MDSAADDDARVAHVTWRHVLPLITVVWGSGDAFQRRALALLVEEIGGIGSRWAPGRLAAAAERGDPVQDAIALAEATSGDGRQRALNYAGAGLEELQQLRLEVRDAISAAPEGAAIRLVRPWLWRVAGAGRPLTAAGGEIRLSKYRADPY